MGGADIEGASTVRDSTIATCRVMPLTPVVTQPVGAAGLHMGVSEPLLCALRGGQHHGASLLGGFYGGRESGESRWRHGEHSKKLEMSVR